MALRDTSRVKPRSATRVGEIYGSLRIMLAPAATSNAPLVRERMWVERFPISILLGAQLVAMIALPAVINQTSAVGTMLGICVAVIAVALYFETMMLPLRPIDKPTRSITLRSANVVLSVGAVAVVGSTLGGGASYAVQIGAARESAITAIFTPFTIWVLFGLVLHFWLFREGQATRTKTLAIAVAICVLQLWAGLEKAILGQSAAFVLTVLVLAVFVRLIRLRIIVVVLLLIPLLWPPLYDLRDNIRAEITGAAPSSRENAALERLQLDKQMAAIDRLSPRPDGLEAPEAWTLIRTGLLPSFIDRDRPPIDTGSRLSIALGGSPTNSQSATMFGNVYIFDGWAGVVLLSAALALAMGAAMRRRSPWALVFAALIYLYGVSFNANYPNIVPQMLQASVSMLLAFAVVRVLSPDSTVRTPRRGRFQKLRARRGATGRIDEGLVER